VKVDFDEGLFHISNGEWFAGTTIVYAAKGDDAFGMRCDYKLSTLAQIETEMEDDGMRHALVSGHDIERWLLKTAKAAAVSKNLSRGRATPFRRVLARLRNTRHAPRPGPLAGGGRTLLHDEYRRPDVESPALAIAAAHQRSRRHRSLGVKHLGLRFVLLLDHLMSTNIPSCEGQSIGQSESSYRTQPRPAGSQ
jgi:hypothetical protein